MPFQEDECAAQGGVCGDSCGCEVEVLHGYCNSQPNSIKCCPQSNNATTEEEMCDAEEEEEEAASADCSGISCPTGQSINNSNSINKDGQLLQKSS